MNPFKQQHQPRNKLLSRFNISMTSRNEHNNTNNINSSR